MTLATVTRSEFTKFFSTSMWWVLSIVLVGYLGMTASGLAASLGALGTSAISGQSTPLPADVVAPLLYSLATSTGYVFPLLIGTLIVTAEFRHKTLSATFLTTPRRGMVLWAKLLAGVVIGAGFALLAVLSTVGPAAGLLAAFGLDTALGTGATWTLLGRMLLALILWLIVGIGVGTLVRNQVAAVVGVLVFTQFLEPIARLAGGFVKGLDTVTNYLPGAAGDALVGVSLFTIATPGGGTSLEWWAGGAVLLAYAVVFLLLGYLVSWRRDVS